jgi:hypothetical protein
MCELIATFVVSKKLELHDFFDLLCFHQQFYVQKYLGQHLMHYKGVRCMRNPPFVASFSWSQGNIGEPTLQ